MYECPYGILYLGEKPECELVRRGKRAKWKTVEDLEKKKIKAPLWRICYSCYFISIYSQFPDRYTIEKQLLEMAELSGEFVVIEKSAIDTLIMRLGVISDESSLENSVVNADLYFSILSNSIVWKTSSPLRKLFSIRKETAVILLGVASTLLFGLTNYNIPAACLALASVLIHLFWGEEDEDPKQREIMRALDCGNYTLDEIKRRTSLSRSDLIFYLRVLKNKKLVETKGRFGNSTVYGLRSSSLPQHCG